MTTSKVERGDLSGQEKKQTPARFADPCEGMRPVRSRRFRPRRQHRLFAVAVAVAAMGCGGSFEISRAASLPAPGSLGTAPARDEARCRSLDSSRRLANVCAIAGVTLTAGTGIASIPVSPEARPYVIGAGLVPAVAAGVCKFLSDDYANAWVRECSQ